MLLHLSVSCLLLSQETSIEKVKSIFDSWQVNATKVSTGTVHIIGKEHLDSVVKNIDIKISFDSLSKREFIHFLWSNSTSGTWLRSKDTITYMEPHGKVINMINAHDSKLSFIKPYDCRYIPLATLSHLEQGIDPEIEWNNVLKTISMSNIKLTEMTDRILCDFLLINPVKKNNQDIRLEIELTKSPDPLISRMTFFRRLLNQKEWTTISTSFIKYGIINNLNLPIELSIKDNSSGKEVKMNLVWSNINEPIDDSEFDIKNFPIRETTLVVDSRMSKSKPVIVGQLEPRSTTTANKDNKDSRFSPTTKLLIVIVLSATVFSMIYFLIRYVTKRKIKSTI